MKLTISTLKKIIKEETRRATMTEGNMSYVRFENTLRDLKDCVEALELEGTEDLSESELDAAENLARVAKRYIEEFNFGEVQRSRRRA